MSFIKCEKECCELLYWNYNNKKYFFKKNKFKAGIIVIFNNNILLIQSRGNLWGFPKGSCEFFENSIKCALREFNEETGAYLSIKDLNLDKKFQIDSSLYFIYDKYIDINITNINNKKDNDVTGIGWVKINCLKEMIQKNKIKTTKHLLLYLQKTFKIL